MWDMLARLIEIAGYGLVALVLVGVAAFIIGFIFFLRSFQ